MVTDSIPVTSTPLIINNDGIKSHDHKDNSQKASYPNKNSETVYCNNQSRFLAEYSNKNAKILFSSDIKTGCIPKI